MQVSERLSTIVYVKGVAYVVCSYIKSMPRRQIQATKWCGLLNRVVQFVDVLALPVSYIVKPIRNCSILHMDVTELNVFTLHPSSNAVSFHMTALERA